MTTSNFEFLLEKRLKILWPRNIESSPFLIFILDDVQDNMAGNIEPPPSYINIHWTRGSRYNGHEIFSYFIEFLILFERGSRYYGRMLTMNILLFLNRIGEGVYHT